LTPRRISDIALVRKKGVATSYTDLGGYSERISGVKPEPEGE
jgi:hypothetical protein